MNLKKLLALLAVAALLVSLMAGCNSSKPEPTPEPTEAPAEETEGDDAAEGEDAAEAGDAENAEEAGDEAEGEKEPYKIALIQQHQDNAFQLTVSAAAEAKAEELGIELEILSADQDAQKQISQIEQCVAEGYDAILYEPVNPDALGDASKAAADEGVVVINIISAVTDWEDYGISAISLGDNVTAGEEEMRHVCELLDGKGNYAILTGPSADSGGLDRLQGYRNILADYPDMKEVVEPKDCAWDTAQALDTVSTWLTAYDLDAIICENDGMAVGAGNAAGKDSGIIITGVDGTPDGFEAIKGGLITGTVSQDGGAMAANGLEAAVKLLNGETLEETTIITTNIWIDADNVADYE